MARHLYWNLWWAMSKEIYWRLKSWLKISQKWRLEYVFYFSCSVESSSFEWILIIAAQGIFVHLPHPLTLSSSKTNTNGRISTIKRKELLPAISMGFCNEEGEEMLRKVSVFLSVEFFIFQLIWWRLVVLCSSVFSWSRHQKQGKWDSSR